MAPIRIYTDWNKRSSDSNEQSEPFRKYFFICEGKNTEVWYFKKLIDLKKQLNIHPLIDIRLLEKTDEDENVSNPKAFIKFAEFQKQILCREEKFDPEHDQIIIVFDADIYKTKPEQYNEILSMKGSNMFAVTNPSFELFLLLHYENAYTNVILPNTEDILANPKMGSRRYITKLFTDVSGMNPKSNIEIGNLAVNIDRAIIAELYINQRIENAIGNITSNIGAIIQSIKEDTIPLQNI